MQRKVECTGFFIYIYVEIDSDPQSVLKKFIAPGPHQLELYLWDK